MRFLERCVLFFLLEAFVHWPLLEFILELHTLHLTTLRGVGSVVDSFGPLVVFWEKGVGFGG